MNGNTITNTVKSPTDNDEGIRIGPNVVNNVVTNNIISGIRTTQLAINDISGRPGENMIEMNTIIL
jgi:hypothetical protein